LKRFDFSSSLDRKAVFVYNEEDDEKRRGKE